MITNFEEITHELTFKEKQYLKLVVPMLEEANGNSKAITNEAIQQRLNTYFNIKCSGARIRKLINFIRKNNLVSCLIATSKGYYTTDNPEEAKSYLTSLKQRENEIREVRQYIEQQIAERFTGTQQKLF